MVSLFLTPCLLYLYSPSYTLSTIYDVMFYLLLNDIFGKLIFCRVFWIIVESQSICSSYLFHNLPQPFLVVLNTTALLLVFSFAISSVVLYWQTIHDFRTSSSGTFFQASTAHVASN